MNEHTAGRRWLHSMWWSLMGSPARATRRRPARRLGLTALEDRLTPANVLANAPEPNQASLTSGFTQSETASIAFGSTVLVAYNDSGSNSSSSLRFTGYARSTDAGTTFTDLGALTSSNDDLGDPVLARDNSNGNIYLTTLSYVSGTDAETVPLAR